MENQAASITLVTNENTTLKGIEIKLKSDNFISIQNLYHTIVIIIEWTMRVNRIDEEQVFQNIINDAVVPSIPFEMVTKNNSTELIIHMSPGNVSTESVFVAIGKILVWEEAHNGINALEVIELLRRYETVREHFYKPVV